MKLEKWASSKQFKPENIFLVLVSIFGLAYTFIQPLFIEPDSSYHFEHVTYISNTVVNRASLGFDGEDYQHQFDYFTSEYRKGTYYTKFFKTKLPVVAKDTVQDKRVIGSNWLNDVQHIVPALGVKFARLFYSSIGAMVIGGRLFNLIFFSLSLYFIIKKLKAYQLLFALVSLSPTVLQFATSLSYDCYNYVAFAYMTATLVNIAVDLQEKGRLTVAGMASRLALPSLVLFFSKSNSKLLYLLVLALFMHWGIKQANLYLSRRKSCFLGLGTVGLGCLLFLVKYHQQLELIFRKFFYTLLEPNYAILSTEILGGTAGNVPLWFFAIEVIGIVFLLLSAKEIRVPNWFAWACLAVAVVNLLGVNLQFAVMPAFGEKVITGSQGRYFTSFILLLMPIFSLVANKGLILVSGKMLKRLVISISVLALIFNLSIISVKFYHLKVPAGRFRSDIESVIFK